MPTSKADVSSLSTRELLEEFAAELARRGAAEAPEEDMSTMELALEAQAERTTAAAYLLRYRTAEAKAILKETAKGKGLVAFESSEALKRWEEGTWALDPE